MKRSAGIGATVFALLVIGAAALAFLLPALSANHGDWPAPLDDVFIYFDFARSAARGHLLVWSPGNGYSSGATSPIYPLLLAPGYLFGLRGTCLGLWAAMIALASLVDLARSIGRVAGGRWVPFAAPLVLVAVPILDWTWFSGLEVAFAMALMGRAVLALDRARSASPHLVGREQWKLGAFGALLSLSRPECAVLIAPLAVSAALGAGSTKARLSLLRTLAPTVCLLGLQALLNRLLTGEPMAAGAIRKLITEDPFASRVDVALLVLRNLAELRTAGIDVALGGTWGSGLAFALASFAVYDRRTRPFAVPLLIGAAGALLLVSLNTTAPFQNLRYMAPTLTMLLCSALFGLAALLRRGPALKFIGGVSFAALLLLPARSFPLQIDKFTRASKNIREQQYEVGLQLKRLDRGGGRVFVGDAGAISYASDLPALDGLGLGGYHDLPFARASVHGVPAVLELIERMPPDQRPRYLAIYDSWWPGLSRDFGTPLFQVHLEDNVICADATKSVYAADWSLLESRDLSLLDRLDVGDLVDEKSHDYRMPWPHAGYVIGAVRRTHDGIRHFDAGRIIPQGMQEQFTFKGSFSRGPHLLRIRSDDLEARRVSLTVSGSATLQVTLEPATESSFSSSEVRLDAAEPGSVVTVVPEDGALRSFAYELVE